MSEQAAPCGCRLVMDRDVLHLFPCRDDCLSIPLIWEAFQKKCPGVPVVDGRPAEDVLGRHITTEEVDALLEAQSARKE